MFVFTLHRGLWLALMPTLICLYFWSVDTRPLCWFYAEPVHMELLSSAPF